jgi:hypothetical protein
MVEWVEMPVWRGIAASLVLVLVSGVAKAMPDLSGFWQHGVPGQQYDRPPYYGESVGHYEGDTLVVDTIGLNDKTWTDRFATPHTEKLHVVERYRLIDGAKTLEVFFTVEDPGAFTTIWSAITRYPRVNVERIEEEACAENNVGYGITVPVADIDPISGAALHDPR